MSMTRMIVALSLALSLIAAGWKVYHSIDAAGYKRAQGCLLYTSPSPRD
jgi:hypothetical protein